MKTSTKNKFWKRVLYLNKDYNQLKDYSNMLFSRGTALAGKQGLCLLTYELEKTLMETSF